MSNTILRVLSWEIRQEDERNWSLTYDTGEQAKDRAGNEKTGVTITRLVGYYDGLGPALKSLVRDSLKGQGATSVQKLIDRLDRVLEEVLKAVESHQ